MGRKQAEISTKIINHPERFNQGMVAFTRAAKGELGEKVQRVFTTERGEPFSRIFLLAIEWKIPLIT
jgi:hypothetical protein